MRSSGRIILIGPTESILTKRGNRFPDFANYLVTNKLEVLYYTSDFYHAEKRRFTRKEINKAKAECPYVLHVNFVIGYTKNISFRRLISNLVYSIKVFVNLLFYVRKTDKILIPSRPVELIYVVSLLRRLRGCEIYLDIQDIWPDALNIKSKIKSKAFIWYCNLFLRSSLKYYTNTIHVAPSFENWLRRYANSTPSTFIPLGWENERWAHLPEVDKVDQYRVRLVCVAQLTYQFDIMPLLEFIKDSPDIFLTVIGEDGSGERYKAVKDFIESNSIKNTAIIGVVPRKKVALYLANEDIGIVPMITTSIPNKVFDYIGARLPIIVLGRNDSAEFVKQHGIGWSCDFNSESFGALMRTINNDDLLQKKTNLENIRMKFSRNHLHAELLEIITK